MIYPTKSVWLWRSRSIVQSVFALGLLVFASGCNANGGGEIHESFVTFEALQAQTNLLFTDIEKGPVGSMVTIWSTIEVGPEEWRCGEGPCRWIGGGIDEGLEDPFGFVGPLFKTTIEMTAPGGPIHVSGIDESLPFTVVKGRVREANAETLQKVLAGAKRGDVIYLRDGRYTPSGSRYGDAVIWAEGVDDVAVVGWPGERAVLLVDDAPGFDTVGDIKGWTIANLEFTSSTGRGQAIRAGRQGRRQNLRVVGNSAHNLAAKNSGALGTWSNTQGLLIAGNRSDQTGVPRSNNSHVIYHGGRGHNRDVVIAYNRISEHRGGRAIQIFGHHEGESLTGLLITGNIITDIVGSSDGILVSHSDRIGRMPPHDSRRAWINDATISNNLIDDVSRFGISIRAAKAVVLINNNAVGKAGAATIDIDFSLTTEISGNCLSSAPRVNQSFTQQVDIKNNETDFPTCME